MTEPTKHYEGVELAKRPNQPRTIHNIPPHANLLAVANHIRDLLEKKKIGYAVMGGLQMLCLGYHREMPDLHIVYDGKDFSRFKKKLEADRRYVVKLSRHSL